MMSDDSKRGVSFAVFGLGMLGGLAGCLASVRGVFTIGANDSAPEILAILFALVTPFFAFIVALWFRALAGYWLIFAGCFLVYGLLDERTFMINARHFSGEPTIQQTVVSALPISLALIAFGSFAVITDRLKWPALMGKRHLD